MTNRQLEGPVAKGRMPQYHAEKIRRKAGLVTAEQLEDLVSLWQGRLGLGGWRLVVEVETPDDEGSAAMTSPTKYSDEARLRFAPWLLGQAERPPEVLPAAEDEVEIVVVHELLHVALRDFDRGHEIIEGYLHRDVEAVFLAGQTAALERSVERLSLSLVRSWPPTSCGFEDSG